MNAINLATCTGANPVRAAQFLAPVTAAMAEYDIDSPGRQAAFLAQIGHESGGLRYTREIWGPTPTQQRYEGRKDLGNVVLGDGKKFKGRGLIQTTGRFNYAATGDALGLPLLEHPELLETPINASRSAGWFWKKSGLNELADLGKFQTITKRVNGGLNGYAERCKLWEIAKKVLAT